MGQNAIDYLKDVLGSITSSKKTVDEGRKKIDEIINSILIETDKPKLPDLPNYDKIDYKPPTDEQLAKRAEDELAEFKNSSQSAINNEIVNLEKKYNADKETAQKSFQQKEAAIEDAYGQAKTGNDNDMLKRGLARSSIAVNTNERIETDKAKQKSSASVALADQINTLESEINGLEAKRAKALDDFNIAYATKLTKNINELKDTREDKVKEALKYNNTIKEKEHDGQIDKIMKESDLYGDALNHKKQGGVAGSSSAQLKAYTELSTALRAMDKQTAREVMLNNPLLSQSMDTPLYYALYNEFAR